MIRTATLDDVPALVELGRRMHEESRTFRAMRFDAAKLAATVSSVVASPHGFARVVVDADDHVIGGMLAILAPHWFSPDLVSCDLALFMAPEHRGGMAAVRLLNIYRQWGIENGAALTKLEVLADIENEKIEQLCSRLGWRRGGVVMVA